MSNAVRPSLFLGALFLTGALVACDTSTPEPQISPNVLDTGVSWTYDVRLTQSPVDLPAVDTVLTTTVQMRVTEKGVQIGERSGLFELELFALSAPDTIDRTWYQQSPDSLVDVAYTTGGQVTGLPLSGTTAQPTPRQLEQGLMGLPYLVRRHIDRPTRLRHTPTDTTLRDDSRLVLQTPLEQGHSWTSFQDPFLSTRTVGGRVTIETPAGRFKTVTVRTALPEQAPSLRWADYYAAEGLVRRVLIDTLRRRNEEGDFLGRYVTQEVYTLTDIQK